jgi:phasin
MNAMNDINTTGGTKSAGTPKMGTPQAVREMADKGITQAKASYEKMIAATGEASSAMQQAHSTAVLSAVASSAKIVEFARINSNAAFDYATRLFAANSPSEFIEVSTDHAREQFKVLSEQAKELAALGQKTMLEATEPLKAGAARMFQPHG